MFSGITLKEWLGLAVVGATISAFGAFLGIVAKEYFFSRSFETWKQKKTLESIFQKFRDPLLLSAKEFASRIYEIHKDYPTGFLNEKVLDSHPEKLILNSADDPYFLRHKLISTAYRVSALLAWIELYRQEVTFLHPGNNKYAKKLEEAVECIKSDFADGQLNSAEDWREWRDVLVFREELRAICESLIETRGTTKSVIGYGRYCEQIEAGGQNPVLRWLPVVLNFFMGLEDTRNDFRLFRLKRLYCHALNLMAVLDKDSIDSYLKKGFKEIDSSEWRGRWV